MVHASDNQGQRDDHLPPGQGNIAWRPLIDQLAQLRFEGAVILEIAGNTDAELILANAQQARRFLRELSRQQSFAPLDDS
jgi:sugar phosphate isomerase/epimerase